MNAIICILYSIRAADDIVSILHYRQRLSKNYGKYFQFLNNIWGEGVVPDFILLVAMNK